ncbi:hypothetical protein evm_000243 [Chilo suppressalis]|nr:hypothetical protein evm_000243 [Chilo suppressalis]
MNSPWYVFLYALLISGATSDAGKESDTCIPHNLWGELLEEWATSAQDNRHGRVMALPPTKGYYVTDRIDGPLTPPPPPPSHGHSVPYGPPATMHGPPPYGPNSHGTNGPHPGYGQGAPQGSHAPHGPPQHPPQPAPGYAQYDEWKATPPPPPGAGKIVNRPTNPYKDKFKPSYQLPNQSAQNQQQPIPVTHPWAVDRVDATTPAAPQKQVSETDLYLLSAIEKLVYRADLMEKRLRRLEDSVHYLVAGKEVKPEPCAGNFTRVGSGCYLLSGEGGDWKAASVRCRKLRAHLLEIDSSDERRALFSLLLSKDQYKGKDFWTGGLNPGLLWIWSHSAKPLNGTEGDTVTVTGAGRCLALAHDPARATYLYRGHDCSLTHRY